MYRFAIPASGALALLLSAQAFPQGATVEAACPGGLSGSGRTNETVCVNLRITDGTNVITADEGRTLEFGSEDGNEQWQLTGNVSIAFGTTEIRADSASFEFENGEAVRGELSGSPVVMTDFVEERAVSIRGEARSISFDRISGEVRLRGESLLVVDTNELRGCDFTYNLNDQSYSVGSTENCGAFLRLAPLEESDSRQGEPGGP